MICGVCRHEKGPYGRPLVDVGPSQVRAACGCGCHVDYRPLVEPEILDFTAWPLVGVQLLPNGQRGVRLVYPGMSVPGLDADEIAITMEPERARRLRDNLSALLKEMGL